MRVSGGIPHQEHRPGAQGSNLAARGYPPAGAPHDRVALKLELVQQVIECGARIAAHLVADPHAHVGGIALGKEPTIAAAVERIKVNLGRYPRRRKDDLDLAGVNVRRLLLSHPAPDCRARTVGADEDTA